MRVDVKFVEREGRKFYYADIGRVVHDRPSFRLWVSGKLVSEEGGMKFVDLPAFAKLHITEKGTVVLKPSNEYFTVVAGWECGYRGRSYLEVISPKNALVRKYHIYCSPRGNLGISEYAIISVPTSEVLRVHLSRDGRLYGAESEMVEEWKVENGKIVYSEYSPELLELSELS